MRNWLLARSVITVGRNGRSSGRRSARGRWFPGSVGRTGNPAKALFFQLHFSNPHTVKTSFLRRGKSPCLIFHTCHRERDTSLFPFFNSHVTSLHLHLITVRALIFAAVTSSSAFISSIASALYSRTKKGPFDLNMSPRPLSNITITKPSSTQSTRRHRSSASSAVNADSEPTSGTPQNILFKILAIKVYAYFILGLHVRDCFPAFLQHLRCTHDKPGGLKVPSATRPMLAPRTPLTTFRLSRLL